MVPVVSLILGGRERMQAERIELVPMSGEIIAVLGVGAGDPRRLAPGARHPDFNALRGEVGELREPKKPFRKRANVQYEEAYSWQQPMVAVLALVGACGGDSVRSNQGAIKEWYQDGTLHRSTAADWNDADDRATGSLHLRQLRCYYSEWEGNLT